MATPEALTLFFPLRHFPRRLSTDEHLFAMMRHQATFFSSGTKDELEMHSGEMVPSWLLTEMSINLPRDNQYWSGRGQTIILIALWGLLAPSDILLKLSHSCELLMPWRKVTMCYFTDQYTITTEKNGDQLESLCFLIDIVERNRQEWLKSNHASALRW